MVLVKSWKSMAFISTVLADFISLVAGQNSRSRLSRHSAEHKYGYTCPAMQRLVFEVGGRISPTIRKQLSAASSEHNTHILRSGMPGLPASDLYWF